MSYPSLPLSYCTNVHPGRTIAEVRQGITDYAAPIVQRCDTPVAAGLWLAEPVIRELGECDELIAQLKGDLERFQLSCYTLNAFPFGDFHSSRVKENVYLPDWSNPARSQYTMRCATILARLLPDNVEGSISTLPLGFKQSPHPEGHRLACIKSLLSTATFLADIESQTGRTIRLAIEPEPCCLLETTPEAVQFFEELFQYAEQKGHAEIARKFLGVCYDVCHQSVEFEDIPASFAALQQAGIRINKVHITCAVELLNPATNSAGREALAKYAEPRYLHQTIAKTRDGRIVREVDLSPELVRNPPPDFLDAPAWRIHFHVPVDAEELGPLQTTRADLKRALAAVKALPYAPHLEVETYTWPVLPGSAEATSDSISRLITGLSNELLSTQKLLAEM